MMATPDVAAAIRQAAKARGATEAAANGLADAVNPDVFLDDDTIDYGKIETLLDAVPNLNLRPARRDAQTGRQAYRARHGEPTSATERGATSYRARRQGTTRTDGDETSKPSTATPATPPTGTLAAGAARYAERHGKADT